MDYKEYKNSVPENLALLNKEEVKWSLETLGAMKESDIQVMHPEWGTTDIKKFMEELLDENYSENK